MKHRRGCPPRATVNGSRQDVLVVVVDHSRRDLLTVIASFFTVAVGLRVFGLDRYLELDQAEAGGCQRRWRFGSRSSRRWRTARAFAQRPRRLGCSSPDSVSHYRSGSAKVSTVLVAITVTYCLPLT